jgi:hypothetical protein
LQDIGTYIEAFNRMIIEGITKDYSISKIIRIGHINRYKFSDENLTKKFIDSSVGKTDKSINEFNLRFSKKYPVEKALVQKGTDDYCNVIYSTEKKADKDDLWISVDYQLYYLPYIPDSSYIKFDSFMEASNQHNKGKFLEWINGIGEN